MEGMMQKLFSSIVVAFAFMSWLLIDAADCSQGDDRWAIGVRVQSFTDLPYTYSLLRKLGRSWAIAGSISLRGRSSDGETENGQPADWRTEWYDVETEIDLLRYFRPVRGVRPLISFGVFDEYYWYEWESHDYYQWTKKSKVAVGSNVLAGVEHDFAVGGRHLSISLVTSVLRVSHEWRDEERSDGPWVGESSSREAALSFYPPLSGTFEVWLRHHF